MPLLGQNVSESDTKMAQEVAQHFVKRLQETRDIKPIIDEMFLADFVPFLACQEDDVPSFYSRLTKSERRRLFILQINVSYLATVDLFAQLDFHSKNSHIYFDSALSQELSVKLAKELSEHGTIPEFSSYVDFQTRLPKIEKVLHESMEYVKKRNIEPTPEFQRRLDDMVTGKGINYRIRVSEITEKNPICGSFGTLPVKLRTRIFRVETPLMFALILVKRGKNMKIVYVDMADDD